MPSSTILLILFSAILIGFCLRQLRNKLLHVYHEKKKLNSNLSTYWTGTSLTFLANLYREKTSKPALPISQPLNRPGYHTLGEYLSKKAWKDILISLNDTYKVSISYDEVMTNYCEGLSYVDRQSEKPLKATSKEVYQRTPASVSVKPSFAKELSNSEELVMLVNIVRSAKPDNDLFETKLIQKLEKNNRHMTIIYNLLRWVT